MTQPSARALGLTLSSSTSETRRPRQASPLNRVSGAQASSLLYLPAFLLSPVIISSPWLSSFLFSRQKGHSSWSFQSAPHQAQSSPQRPQRHQMPQQQQQQQPLYQGPPPGAFPQGGPPGFGIPPQQQPQQQRPQFPPGFAPPGFAPPPSGMSHAPPPTGKVLTVEELEAQMTQMNPNPVVLPLPQPQLLPSQAQPHHQPPDNFRGGQRGGYQVPKFCFSFRNSWFRSHRSLSKFRDREIAPRWSARSLTTD